MDRRDKARALVLAALGDVEAELAASRPCVCKEQLGACRETLRGYLAALDDGALPPRRERDEELGRMIVDSWPYDAPLGQVILQAERAFRNA